MTTSDKGIELIKEFEGFRKNPYFDAVQVPTIGFGSTFYEDGTIVTMTDPPVTEEEATDLLKDVVKQFEEYVNKYITSDISQVQFDALVSFTYNLGPGNLKSSTLLKKVNIDPCDPTIFDEFKRWNKAGGKVLSGLKKRRIKEAELYFS